MKHVVFICASIADVDISETLRLGLEKAGIPCWSAGQEFAEGKGPGDAPAEALKSARMVLLIVSAFSDVSTRVIQEVTLAMSRNIPILPYRAYGAYERQTSGRLNQMMAGRPWFDGTQGSIADHAEALAGIIRERVPELRGLAPGGGEPGGGNTWKVGQATIELVVGDMIRQAADAIVIPTNCYLVAVTTDGIDAAVRQAAGPELAQECNAIGQCKTGMAVITGGGRLAPRKVIHTVPSSWKGGEEGEEKTLEGCYHHSLAIADRNGLSTLVFPALGTGYLKFPVEKAADAAARAVCGFLRSRRKPEKVILVFADETEVQAYAGAFERERLKATTTDELQESYDVFISFKSVDLVHARRVYDYLTGHGVKTFISSQSIDDVGEAGFVKVILAAINRSKHMVVVTSAAEHISEDMNPEARWVEKERHLYLANRLSGRTSGNLLTLVTGECIVDDLPLELRSEQIFELSDEGLARVLSYVTGKVGSGGGGRADRRQTPKGCIRVSDFLVLERPLENVSWDAAREYAASLKIGGKGGWDLPSREQLKQIRAAGLFKKERYYSRDEQGGEVYYVHFEDGHAGVTPKDYRGRGLHAIFVCIT